MYRRQHELEWFVAIVKASAFRRSYVRSKVLCTTRNRLLVVSFHMPWLYLVRMLSIGHGDGLRRKLEMWSEVMVGCVEIGLVQYQGRREQKL
jgi:hypothetical protein